MSKSSVLFCSLLCLTAAPLRPHELPCSPGSRPYLEVISYSRFPPPRFLPGPDREERHGVLVCYDRRVVLTNMNEIAGEPPASVFINSGRLRFWEELREAAGRARVGVQGSCSLFAPVLPPRDHRMVVVWHGAGARRNRFEVDLHPEDPLPTCSLELEAFWQLLLVPELEDGDQVVRIP